MVPELQACCSTFQSAMVWPAASLRDFVTVLDVSMHHRWVDNRDTGVLSKVDFDLVLRISTTNWPNIPSWSSPQ
jgi:hypothetical protein